MIITDKDLKEKGIQAIKDALQEENVIQFDDNGKMIDFNLMNKEFKKTIFTIETKKASKEKGKRIQDIKKYGESL